MTPEEKAKELVKRFIDLVDFTDDECNTCLKSRLARQKQCALICVDEQIIMMEKLYYDYVCSERESSCDTFLIISGKKILELHEVKQEIETL